MAKNNCLHQHQEVDVFTDRSF